MSSENGTFKIKPSQEHRFHKQMAGQLEGPSNTVNALAPPVVPGAQDSGMCLLMAWHSFRRLCQASWQYTWGCRHHLPCDGHFLTETRCRFSTNESNNLLVLMAGLLCGHTLLHSHRFLGHCQQLSQLVRRMTTEWLETALDRFLSHGGLCCPLLPRDTPSCN